MIFKCINESYATIEKMVAAANWFDHKLFSNISDLNDLIFSHQMNNTSDFSIWGYVQQHVYQKLVQKVDQLKEHLMEFCILDKVTDV